VAPRRDAALLHHPGATQLYFTTPAAAAGAPAACGSGHSTLSVPVVSDAGAPATLVVHAERRVSAPGAMSVGAPLSDATPWVGAANSEQAVRMWVPFAPNRALAAGRWRSAAGGYALQAWSRGAGLSAADAHVDEVPVIVDLTFRPAETIVDFTAADRWSSAPLQAPDDAPSSIYFHAFVGGTSAPHPRPDGYFSHRDLEQIGPTGTVWYGEEGQPAKLQVLVVDQADPAAATELYLPLKGYHETCGGTLRLLNAGEGANTCEHRAVLEVDMEALASTALVAGHTYATPPARPLVLRGMRWHDPHAGAVVREFAVEVRYTASEEVVVEPPSPPPSAEVSLSAPPSPPPSPLPPAPPPPSLPGFGVDDNLFGGYDGDPDPNAFG